MSASELYATINSAKESFDHIYNQPIPHGYFTTLGGLDYEIPSNAKPVLQSVIAGLREARGIAVPTVLDLGCSYGINGALLKYDLEVADLVSRYRGRELNGTPVGSVIGEDARFFARLDAKDDLRVVGLDSADRAVRDAVTAGIIDAGIAANLEVGPLDPAAAAIVAGADLIASTGCVGYVTERTFDRLAAAATGEDGLAPWVASFVLRVFPYDEIASTLSDWNLVTEKLDGRTFAQRRFASDEEQAETIQALERRGIDPTGLETEGRLHAEFYLSRPECEATALPLAALVPDA